MLVKKVEIKQKPFLETKLEGLKLRKPDNVKFILQIERTWERYALDRTNEKTQVKLFNSLSRIIRSKAGKWERRWKNKRLSKSDFESVFSLELFKIAEKYHQYGTFYFYETFILAIERRAIDETRKLLTMQGSFESTILPLQDETVNFIPDKRINLAEDFETRETVFQVLNEPSLSQQEKTLLHTLYNNPDNSYRELAQEIGFNHHEQVTRSLKKINKKVSYIF